MNRETLMVGSLRRRCAALLAALLTAACLSVVTAPPAAAAESYVVSYPLPARYYVDSSQSLTVGVTDFEPDVDPDQNVRTAEVRAVYPDGSSVEHEVTLTLLVPSATVPFPTQRRAPLAYSVTFFDADGDFLDQRAFTAEIIGWPSDLKAGWPTASRIRERTSYVVRGQVAGGARKVLVQRKATGTWITLGAGQSQANGSYAVKVDTRWVTTHRLRALVTETRTHNADVAAKPSALTVTRSYKPRPGTAWKPIHSSGFPGQRWTPCGAAPGVLTYRVNPARAPRGYLAEIRKAFAQVTAATGFGFRYAGTTTLVPLKPGSQAITRKADVTIAYATARMVPALRGGVIGVSPVASQYAYTDWWRVFAAAVVLDTQAGLAPGFGGGKATRGSVLIHELGHVMGLDHVSDRRQIMYPAITRAEARYANGDLRGLANVAVSRGCFPFEPNPYGRAGSTATARRLPPGPTRTVVHTVGLAP
ncbi:hypothetical protein NSZ01_10720 [Nocardioides szechwanensis]|uniref:Matrixin n=1 Tax=Nocardioides szechwanensis TaxID=1005944 RepID=A0A1H0CWZ5_9ACTN|nr:matrixin family metalloprotease [Nocardioides szechwanensis]GEP33304.1 hypothetical protein NSZ01_10720 [Nocardioides szechwanensis]SDN62414.1 Matrixin [Nocardioides szechwanensis]